MGDALSKPAEPWEDELPASPPAQQVPPVDAAVEQPTPSDRRRVKVSSARLKPADAGGGPPAASAGTPVVDQRKAESEHAAAAEEHQPAARDAAGGAAASNKKRKAAEPADGDASESKRQQLLGLTILTLGVLQGLVPFAPSGARLSAGDVGRPVPAIDKQQQQQQRQHQEEEVGGAQGVPTVEQPASYAEDAAGLGAVAAAAAAPPPPQQAGMAEEQEAGEAVQCTPPQEVPLSAAKPVSRSQLRQQLQLRSQRVSSAHSPAVRAAGRVVGTSAAADAVASLPAAVRSTRGQRLLGLVRHQPAVAEAVTAQHASAPEDLQQGAQLFPAGDTAVEGTDVDLPAGGTAAAEQQVPGGVRQLAQRRLTQSPCCMAAPSVVGGSEAEHHELQADMPAKATGGECTPPRPPPVALSTPTIAEPGSAPRPANAAARAAAAGALPARQPSGSPLQAASAQEGDVEVALQQVGRLLVDLRGDSPLWQRTRASEPACPPELENARPEATLRLDSEVQSTRQASPAPVFRQQADAAQPPSPQEVSSKQRLQEEGADNFPGFWRPPAAGSPSATSEPAVPRRRSSRKRANPVQIVIDKQERRPQPQQQWAQPQPVEGSVEATPTRGRKRKVRFCVPEEQEAQPTAAAAPQEQHPTPLVVAPPVLPSGRAGSGAGRPSTPAKPAPLRVPQPPAFSRFGAAAFHRPYAGPQGRRQALMSFVSEGGANCFALPPVPPVDVEGSEGPAGPAPDTTAASPSVAAGGEDRGLVIPRRLQHRQGLGRRLSMQPDPPLLQGHELLAQEVREAFLNAKLADHAGEPWARLDVAGCELRPSSAHAEALAELSSKLEAQRGAEVMRQLLNQLDAEWQHLKRLRQKYVGGVAAVAASISPPHAQAAASSPAATSNAGSTDEAARPRGILKHKSSLSSNSQACAAAAAAAAVKEVAAQEQAEQAAAAADVPLAAAGFEAILAADIVGEAAPAELAPPAAPEPPAVPAPEPPTSQPQEAEQQAQQQPQQAGPHAEEVYDAASPVPPGITEALQLTAAATAAAGTAAPAAETASAPSGAAAAAPMRVAAGEPAAPAGVAAQAEAGQEQEPLSPRPVELTPGPSLSRGQKMLARLGTPLAAGKLQLLSGTDMGRKVASASPLFAARTSGGGVVAPPRRAGGRMSRGERLLAVAKGGNGAPCAAASPAPAGQAGEGAPEEGPTLARAAAVLL